MANEHSFPPGGRPNCVFGVLAITGTDFWAMYYERSQKIPIRGVTCLPESSVPLIRSRIRGRRPRQKWTLGCYTQALQEVCGGVGRYALGTGDIKSSVMQGAFERRF